MRGDGKLDATMDIVASPLTLTLSRREREQLLVFLVKFVSREAACRRRFTKKLGAFLSLKREGRGEGKPSELPRDAPSSNSMATVLLEPLRLT
jgi:hypothetical protein